MLFPCNKFLLKRSSYFLFKKINTHTKNAPFFHWRVDCVCVCVCEISFQISAYLHILYPFVQNILLPLSRKFLLSPSWPSVDSFPGEIVMTLIERAAFSPTFATILLIPCVCVCVCFLYKMLSWLQYCNNLQIKPACKGLSPVCSLYYFHNSFIK